MNATPPRYHHPEAIVTTGWLAARLEDPALRIFDCTTHLEASDDPARPYRVVSGRAEFEEAHIPGSAHLDLQADLSDADSPFAMTAPAPVALAAAFGGQGIGDQHRVVLYSRNYPQWATRVWWMLRYVGFDNAAILDGGWDQWNLEGRATGTGPAAYPAASLTPNPRPELFVGKAEVRATMDRADHCAVNALAPESYRGENSRYGRPGRVPGSINIPAADLLDPDTTKIIPPETAAAAFSRAGVKHGMKLINYCGGGIWATMDAFILHQLGHADVAVYDNSMNEWASDKSLPMEIG